MLITINGESREVDDACTVTTLLDTLELGGAACAVEVNRHLVRKAEHADHVLHDGDSIEIVTLVGGG